MGLAPTRGVMLLVLFGLSGCLADQINRAPFRQRPDSVDAGSLQGPFSGRILDESTGDPIVGALVYATWGFTKGTGTQQPAGFRERILSTNENGEYKIDKLSDVPRGRRLASFQIVVYKRGYVGYRSDRRFADFGPRLDFAQKNLLIRLERWRKELSHVRHVRYLGGGAAISALTAWEVDAAAAELTGKNLGPKVTTDFVVQNGSVYSAASLLNENDIRELTGFDGNFEPGPLNDEPDTESYSSQHFKAIGRQESFDLAVRLWKIPKEETEKRYTELTGTLPNLQVRDEVADKSARAVEKEISGYIYASFTNADEATGSVVLLTCGQSLCPTPDIVVKLAKRSYEKLRLQGHSAQPSTPGKQP